MFCIRFLRCLSEQHGKLFEVEEFQTKFGACRSALLKRSIVLCDRSYIGMLTTTKTTTTKTQRNNHSAYLSVVTWRKLKQRQAAERRQEVGRDLKVRNFNLHFPFRREKISDWFGDWDIGFQAELGRWPTLICRKSLC